MFAKITILYDNTSFRKNLESDWGFSCLVEVKTEKENHRILFDTGANGKILLSNMKKLAIDPLLIEEIFISHLHFDHVGGLSDFLKINQKIKKIYLPSSLGIENEVIIKEPTKIYDNIFSTGELDGIEQSMGIITKKGIVLIVGCSHPKISHIFEVSRKFGEIYGIIGGLHGFSEFELFKNLKLICPTHCTQYKQELKKLYPNQYIQGGAGQVITI